MTLLLCLPLFEETLRHIELCNIGISQIQRNPPKLFLQCILKGFQNNAYLAVHAEWACDIFLTKHQATTGQRIQAYVTVYDKITKKFAS